MTSVAAVTVVLMFGSGCLSADDQAALDAPTTTADQIAPDLPPPTTASATDESSPIEEPSQPPIVADATPSHDSDVSLLPRPVLDALPPATDEQLAAALAVEPAPLGTFVVAKPTQGIPLAHSPTSTGQSLLEVPVYDEPFGEPRVLAQGTEFVGQFFRFPLLHRGEDSPPLVLRVIAGGPDDEWIKVQAPTFPHGRSVWVQSLYFDFGFTPTRIEIDLAGRGHLRLIEGGSIMLDSPIVKGRDQAPTPHHLTYVAGAQREPDETFYGAARLDLASYRHGPVHPGGELERAVISGNEDPALMGQAVSLGEVRVPDDVILDLARDVVPGTPVLIFDSSRPSRTRAAINIAEIEPAVTTSFLDTEPPITTAAVLDEPQLWQHCAVWQGSLCEAEVLAPADTLVPVGNVFVTARDGAGEPFGDAGALIPVYDEPGGPMRHLVDSNDIDAVELVFPLLHPNVFMQPLVLNVLQGAPGDEWLLVQAPIRPHRQSIWVRAEDFLWGQTLNRIEVDLGRDGLMTVFDGNEEVISSISVYGRESRPTTLHDTYVEQKFEGRRLSPAYGTHILTLASYSEALGTFGGGGLPGQSLHGTNQPELIGQRVSSGGIRVPNEVIDVVYAQPDIVGAGVIIFDSSGIGREAAIRLQRLQRWFPARTSPFTTAIESVPVPSYS